MGRKKGSNKNDDFKDWVVEIYADVDCTERVKYSLYSSAQKIADDLQIPVSKVYNHYYNRVKPKELLKFIKISRTDNSQGE